MKDEILRQDATDVLKNTAVIPCYHCGSTNLQIVEWNNCVCVRCADCNSHGVYTYMRDTLEETVEGAARCFELQKYNLERPHKHRGETLEEEKEGDIREAV